MKMFQTYKVFFILHLGNTKFEIPVYHHFSLILRYFWRQNCLKASILALSTNIYHVKKSKTHHGVSKKICPHSELVDGTTTFIYIFKTSRLLHLGPHWDHPIHCSQHVCFSKILEISFTICFAARQDFCRCDF